MVRGRIALLALGAASLLAGIAGGLVRLGAPVELPAAAAAHGPLMVGGFLGTVISLERAVALGLRWAYAAPLASGLALWLALAGATAASSALMVLAPLLLFAASVAIIARQALPHTILLAVAALAWGAGNVLNVYALPHLAYPFWFAFLVLTIAAERLELTRLARRREAAAPLFSVVVAALLGGAVAGAIDYAFGTVLFGVALVALAAWLAAFDIAWRTARAGGFAGYAGRVLLGGYAWLAVAGIAWAGCAFDPRLRDIALHALALGFVFSMIFAHAPLIVPVVAKVRMRFVPAFYAPVALLHASLLLRFAAGYEHPAWRLAGGCLNAAAIVIFVAILLRSLARGDDPVDARQRAAPSAM